MADPTRGKVSIDISKAGAKAELEAGGVDRLSHALADLFSPITEITGYVGDHFRIYRVNNILRAIGKAKSLSLASGIQLQPVSPKFLAPWLEGVSLEEDNENDLSDLWAGILVSESSISKPANNFFREALTQLTARHIDFLSYVCNVKRSELQKITKSTVNLRKSAEIILGPKFYIPVMRGEKSHVEASRDLLAHRETGILIYEIAVSTGRDSYRSRSSQTIGHICDPIFSEFESDMTLHVIEKLGFIELGNKSIEFSDPDFSNLNQSGDDIIHGIVKYCALTPFGLGFINACTGDAQ